MPSQSLQRVPSPQIGGGSLVSALEPEVVRMILESACSPDEALGQLGQDEPASG